MSGVSYLVIDPMLQLIHLSHELKLLLRLLQPLSPLPAQLDQLGILALQLGLAGRHRVIGDSGDDRRGRSHARRGRG